MDIGKRLGIYIALTAAFFTFHNTVYAQQPQAELKWTVLGSSLKLMAKASENHVIQFCRWDSTGDKNTRPGGIVFVNNNDSIPSSMISAQQSQVPVAGYPYYGAGLSKGECGIRIENVTEADITLWKCLVIEFDPNDPNPGADPQHTQINVAKAVPPAPPTIMDKAEVLALLSLADGVTLVCCVENGIPDPKLSFLFDDKLVDPEYVLESPSASEFKVCSTWKNVHLTRNDDGKRIKCISDHVTNPDSRYAKEDYIDLQIKYPPEILTTADIHANNTIFLRVTSEGSKEIEVRFSSNPKSEVTWSVQGSDGFYRKIDEKLYTTGIREVADMKNTWDASLLLNSLNLGQSTAPGFRVLISNKFGSNEINIQTKVDYANEVSEPEPERDLFWLLYIVIVVIVIVIILIIVFVFTKRNGWLCYKKKTGMYKTQSKLNSKPTRKTIETECTEDADESEIQTVYNPLMTSPV